MKGLLICTAIWLGCAINCRPALAEQYYFDSWTTDNGMPQNSVNSILQTRDGYLWISTNDGLVRYDGARFTIFNRGNTAGMNENRCYRLLEDSEGVLWVRAEFGLMSYSNGSFHSYTVDDGLPEGRIFQIFEHKGGGLVILSSKGVFIWRNHQSYRLPADGGQPRVFAYQDKAGGLWFDGEHVLV
ncbi:MAG TPA: two-component regulator propeller domain-containing protein, partial [Blastocatellia bacterium]|nr:two-component regulator propeller domain-containing protein [Blastocatellia bacterium]